MRKNTFLITIILMIAFCNPVSGQHVKYNNIMLDTQENYEVSFGPTIEGYLGQDNLIVPIWLTNEEPVEYVHLIITYDPSMIMPTVVAPAFFVQHFNYDLNIAGQIEIELKCNLVPPPYVPPIPAGDTVISFILRFISCDPHRHMLRDAALFFGEQAYISKTQRLRLNLAPSTKQQIIRCYCLQ